jgi:hypothetical protein
MFGAYPSVAGALECLGPLRGEVPYKQDGRARTCCGNASPSRHIHGPHAQMPAERMGGKECAEWRCLAFVLAIVWPTCLPRAILNRWHGFHQTLNSGTKGRIGD